MNRIPRLAVNSEGGHQAAVRSVGFVQQRVRGCESALQPHGAGRGAGVVGIVGVGLGVLAREPADEQVHRRGRLKNTRISR